jgi:hypothetical protein
LISTNSVGGLKLLDWKGKKTGNVRLTDWVTWIEGKV